jgi:sugar phosphate isomerase/epimerase
MSATMKFGVQSFCFRNFKDNAEVAAKVNELGLDQIEVCGVHADFNDVDGWRRIVDTYKQAGVQIVSLGVQTFTGDEATERQWFECAQAAGAKYISAHFKVDSFTDAVPLAARLGDEYDVSLAIHCHGGYSFGGAPDAMEHLLALGGPRIGLCLDTAWCMQLGPRHGDPLAWADRFQDRLYGVHFKDFVFGRDAMWEDVVVGTGNLDLPAFVTKLQEIGFDGYAVLEYEADADNPVPALAKCVDAVKAQLPA